MTKKLTAAVLGLVLMGVACTRSDPARPITVGAIYPLTSIPTEPYFSLMNEEDTLISWEIPDYPMDARVLTYEQRATDENGKSRLAIVRQVSVITGGLFIDDGESPYYQAICLAFDKAYADGASMDYVISNLTIDEIARSLKID
jgi:hypothetical protein